MDYLGPVRAHRNLNARNTSETWSFYTLPKNGPVRRSEALLLHNVTMKQPNMNSKAVKECIINKGHRSVFAWLKADNAAIPHPARQFQVTQDSQWHRLHFNPTKGQQCFQDHNGNRIDNASVVMLCNNGQAYFTQQEL